jgi:hypothetical protein
MGRLEAARTPVRVLARMRDLRRAIDAEDRLGRLADLGSLFGSQEGRRHAASLAARAAGRDAPARSGKLMRDEGGRTVEGGPYVPGLSYVVE